jgi:hypothetical protein
MVRILLVIEVPDASDKGMVTIGLRPIDSCSLSCESAEDMVRMVFDHVIVNVRSFRAALRTRFYVNVRHTIFSLSTVSGVTGSAGVSFFEFLGGATGF